MATEKEKKIDPKSLSNIMRYDSKTGKLYWLPREPDRGGFNVRFAGKEAFTCIEAKGYLNGRVFGTHLKAHRVAWALHHGDWPSDQIDHINGVKDDNRIENLRVVSNGDNCRNKAKPKNNTSGWVGVAYNKRAKLWVAKYRLNYKDHTVGYFRCPTAAHIAITKARIGEFHENHGR